MSCLKQKFILNWPENLKNKQALKEIIFSEFSLPQTEQVKAIRNWVNTNSSHNIDGEHDQYAFQIHKVLEKLLHYHTTRNSPPHLSCGPRSYAMKEILKLVGVQSRVIDIFQVLDGVVNPHTLLEVYCNDTDRWILQDPDFNTEYVLTAEESLPLSSKSAFLADKSRIHYSTNGYQIENKQNCVNTIAHCFDQCVLHRLSYDGNRSIAFIKDNMVLNNMVTSGDQEVTFRQFLNQRGQNPHIIVLS
tara:strand:- start:201 stop:938 length:738 start_codon:yes stop_codon:yes gene_type:complete